MWNVRGLWEEKTTPRSEQRLSERGEKRKGRGVIEIGSKSKVPVGHLSGIGK